MNGDVTSEDTRGWTEESYKTSKGAVEGVFSNRLDNPRASKREISIWLPLCNVNTSY